MELVEHDKKAKILYFILKNQSVTLALLSVS